MKVGKEQILRDNRQAWDSLMKLVQGVPTDRMLETDAVGQWSLKDMLGHVATWDVEVAREVRQLARGGPRITRPKGFNDLEVAVQRAMSLEEVLTLLEMAHDRAMAYLASLPEAAYGIEGVEQRAHGCMAHHYAEHTEDVRRWLNTI